MRAGRLAVALLSLSTSPRLFVFLCPELRNSTHLPSHYKMALEINESHALRNELLATRTPAQVLLDAVLWAALPHTPALWLMLSVVAVAGCVLRSLPSEICVALQLNKGWDGSSPCLI